MKSALSRVSGLLILLMFAGGIPMTAQRMASLTLPATTGHGSNVYGTATINRFEKQGNQITAIGFVKNSSGTEFQGVRWQLVTVTSSTGTLSATSGHAPAAPQLTRIAWSPGRGNSVKLVPVQAPPPTSCGVLNISLAGASINVAGAQVSLDPITLNISGQSGTPVGDLVCSALNLLGNVAGLVNLLNSLLGTLTGALGGLTGGL